MRPALNAIEPPKSFVTSQVAKPSASTMSGMKTITPTVALISMIPRIPSIWSAVMLGFCACAVAIARLNSASMIPCRGPRLAK